MLWQSAVGCACRSEVAAKFDVACQSPSFETEPRGILHTFLYSNHDRRLRLEKLSYLELSRSSNGFFKPLLDPGGGFRS